MGANKKLFFKFKNKNFDISTKYKKFPFFNFLKKSKKRF